MSILLVIDNEQGLAVERFTGGITALARHEYGGLVRPGVSAGGSLL